MTTRRYCEWRNPLTTRRRSTKRSSRERFVREIRSPMEEGFSPAKAFEELEGVEHGDGGSTLTNLFGDAHVVTDNDAALHMRLTNPSLSSSGLETTLCPRTTWAMVLKVFYSGGIQ
ncbi:uncharacterized protein LOC111240568 [Vigna radiata var. radiata]|uniref:Uncharacterized protein LOC111240568 n=1 Tax=Vigna radiata var. radiata TaxID=3916 RepID=A0A3Q0EHD9_VIGRR|nr:uncharacterized protein LOC111240568 [Vigna radiata var. radiata]